MTFRYLVGSKSPITRLPSTFPNRIDEDVTLGIDLGIGSCGLAVASWSDTTKPVIQGFEKLPGPLVFLGVRAFDVPETRDTQGKPQLKNPERRQKRLLRRVTKRRAQRMREVRALLIKAGLLPSDYHPQADDWRSRHEAALPWEWRVKGLNQLLSGWEWAAVLMYIAKHRGFRSNRKSDLESKGKEGGTLQSARTNRAALSEHRSVAELFANDPRFAQRKRNREGSYTAMVYRADLMDEISVLFEAQRRFGNPHAEESLRDEFVEIMQRQKPLQNPIDLLDDCAFEKGEKRGSRLAPSFELSRALQKLNSISITIPGQGSIRLADWVGAESDGFRDFINDFGSRKSISWKVLRETFELPENATFDDVVQKIRIAKPKKGQQANEPSAKERPAADPEASDFVTSSTSRSCAEGTFLLRKALGEEIWVKCLTEDRASLDDAAFCLTFFEIIEDPSSDQTILGDLAKRCSKSPDLIEAVRANLTGTKPTLHRFSGSCSLSAAASRKILPLLEKGRIYSTAMEEVYGDHRESDFALDKITNPIVKAVLRESMKQLVHLVDQLGCLPGRINIELARDLGKSLEERNEISKGLHDRTEAKNAHRRAAADLLHKSENEVSEDELLRYELYLEQGGACPYSGDPICPDRMWDNDHFQVDHILPRSRSQDNGYDNKVLVFTGQNQNKRSQTPFEWLEGPHSAKWQEFVVRIGTMKSLRGRKKRNLRDTTFATREAEFLERNLNDTRYISRLMLAYVEDLYRIAGEESGKKGSKRRVFVRPGQMISLVRRVWNLENLKKDRNNKRLGDKHHAVDALVCACLGEASAQWVTRISKAWRDMELRDDCRLALRGLQPPWENFRHDVVTALESFTVSRRERCHGRGALHDDTLYGVRMTQDGDSSAWQRVSMLKIDKGKKTPRFPTIESLQQIRGFNHEKNQWLRDALTQWVEAGAQVAELPKDTFGCEIRKVFVRSNKDASLRKLPQGYVNNGNMVRCDVFSKKGKYFLVPVYSHQLANDKPPMKAIVAAKPETSWDVIDDSFAFEFSLWKNSRFVARKTPTARKPSSEAIRGIYASVNRNTAKIDFRDPDDAEALDGISVKQGVVSFQKFHVDRLGRLHLIKREKRTWRGGVCT
jgi:CRISPR-associated endonuclease Csn1